MTDPIVPVWFQILIGFGGFTICNVVAMSVLWGRMTKTIENHSDRICNLETRINPDDSSLRFLTIKDCTEKQSTVMNGIVEIKLLIRELDKNHSDRMTRIEGRRDELLSLIYNKVRED